ncbi:Heat shock cognate 70 kDa protein [Taenia solium]|eukprot:TsM_001190500 transcript=TsM_001190500 gene=TsM_001190500
MLSIVDKALRDAKLERADVHEVLLAGGATRVLKLQNTLQNVFKGSKFIKSINPDEAAACGAALLASGMINEQSLIIQEVAPLSVNLVTSNGVIEPLIKRNVKIPMKKSVTFTTPLNHRCELLLRVYAGRHATANANNFLGEFQVLGIAPSRSRSHRIEVTFAIDTNGLLNVSAVAISSGKQVDVHANHTGCLSQKQMEQMMNEAKRLKEENERQRRKMAARNKLEDRIFTIQMEMENEEIRRKVPKESRKEILSTCGATLKRIESDNGATEEDYKEMLRVVESESSHIVAAKQNGWQVSRL